jgi:hypothetical protein
LDLVDALSDEVQQLRTPRHWYLNSGMVISAEPVIDPEGGEVLADPLKADFTVEAPELPHVLAIEETCACY